MVSFLTPPHQPDWVRKSVVGLRDAAEAGDCYLEDESLPALSVVAHVLQLHVGGALVKGPGTTAGQLLVSAYKHLKSGIATRGRSV